MGELVLLAEAKLGDLFYLIIILKIIFQHQYSINKKESHYAQEYTILFHLIN